MTRRARHALAGLLASAAGAILAYAYRLVASRPGSDSRPAAEPTSPDPEPVPCEAETPETSLVLDVPVSPSLIALRSLYIAIADELVDMDSAANQHAIMALHTAAGLVAPGTSLRDRRASC